MEQIKIDIVPVGVAPVAHASQFDNGRQIRFNLFNQGTPYTLTGAETVTMVVNGEEENITNTSDNYVIWDVAEEDCEKVGVIGCEIRIVLGSMLIGSKNFFLEVEMDPYNGKNIRIVTVGPADICTFETTLPEPYQSVLVNIVATGGYDADTQTAHPIVGYSSANITRCGVNFANNNLTLNWWCDGSGNVTPSTNGARTDYIPIHDRTVYFKVFQPSYLYSCSIVELDASLNFIKRNHYASGFGNEQTVMLDSDTKFIYIQVYNEQNIMSLETYTNAQVMLGLSSGLTTYYAYNGQTYAIPFGQTVYGGVRDVTRGKLHVTHGNQSFNGSENWWVDSANTNRFGLLSGLTPTANYTTFKANYLTPSLWGTIPYSFALKTDGSLYVMLDNTATQMTLAEFKTYLSDNPLQICYELATPFDIDLTPVQIRALVGENNVFADCGQTTVEYVAEE